jgi:glutamate dehydrogenase/leucine dehydrogenase
MATCGRVADYFERVQDLQSFFWGKTDIVDSLFRILGNTFTQIITLSRKQKIPLRLAAAGSGCETIICYWGVVKSARKGLESKPVS